MPATQNAWDKITAAVGPVATPVLVKTGFLWQGIYQAYDKSFGVPKANSCIPLVVFCSRTVKDIATYKEQFTKFAETAMKAKGVRCCISFVDRDKTNTVLQLYWYDSPADYVKAPGDLTGCYCGSAETDYCQIWGEWTEEFKAAITTKDCKYAFVKEMRGFIREPSEANKAGFTTGSPPMIWISKRNIKPGRMAACGHNFQKGTDMMFTNAPAALSVAEFTDEVDPDATWSLRVFNDFDNGFKAHFPIPSFILFRMAYNVIPEWVPGPYPLGFSFSTKQHIDMAVTQNAGNKNYTQYHWETDLIGPKPDFGKGF